MPIDAELKEKIEAATAQAASELDDISPEAVSAMRDWWRRWYLEAGHRALGRLLLRS